MEVKFTKKLSFLNKEGVQEGFLDEVKPGKWVFRTSAGFKQNLKKSEADAILEASGLVKASLLNSNDKDYNPDSDLSNDTREKELAAMSKNDLIAEAESLGIQVNAQMSKQQIIETILNDKKGK